MPDPQPGESREDFMAHCIPETMRDGGAENNDQAVAICASKWEDRDKVVEKTYTGKSAFTSFKAADGRWRWLSVSSMAIEDREGEVVSEQAYDDAIALAQRAGRGELDLVHLKGTDVGDCDFQTRLGMMLVEGGTWRDTPMAQKARVAVAANPDRWGVSLQFRYDPSQFDGRTYTGGIQIRKRSILPREMAASLGTAITTIGGDMEMTEQVKQALGELGLDDNEITEIAERQKSVTVEEPHVVNKAEGVMDKIKHLIANAFGGGAEAPEAGGAENATEAFPAVSAEPEPVTEPVVAPEAEKTDKPPAEPVPAPEPREAPTMVLSEDAQKAIALTVAGVMSAGVAEALTPVVEKMAGQQAALEALTARLAVVEQTTEDRVMQRLRELPPIVKAAPTMIATALAAETEPAEPETDAQKSYAKQLFAAVSKSIEDTLKGFQPKYQP